MNRLAVVSILSLVAVVGCGTFQGPAPADPGVRVQILHTNDFHGRLLPAVVAGDTIGGAAVLAAWYDSARVRFEGPTVLLSAGDVFQGTAVSNLSWGRASIDVTNRMGFDAAALGNHEFDWGVDTLRARVGESTFPWLAANVFDEATGAHPEWIRPWVVIERDGVRIGVVGIALSETPQVVMAGRTEGLRFEAEAPAADRAIRAVRGEGVDFVVLTAHLGAYCDDAGNASGLEPEAPSVGCTGGIVDMVAALTERPDLVLGGHTHMRNRFEVNGIPISQAPAYSGGVTMTHLERAPNGTVRATYQAIVPPRRAEVDPDTVMLRVVEGWTREVRPLLERPVAVLADSLSNAGRLPRENPAGNLLADAQRWATGATIGFVNNGSLRRSLPAGTLTYETLYEFQPFQNELVRLEGNGAWLREVLEFGLNDDGAPWTHVSGIRVEIDPSAPRGARVLRILWATGGLDDGTEIGPDDRVSIGTTEFLALGGDGFTVLREGSLQRVGVVDLDGLADWLRSLPSPVSPPAVGRWVPRPR
jgi:2',3'-cyclic-nucleotide 2'-phosphodiesterase (5'-nucleotidase family)